MATNISTEAELQACYLDLTKDYTLVNDIAITANFRPYAIGKTYAKTFDGGGFSITGFQLSANGSEFGLFRGLATNGVIQNVNIPDATITLATANADYRQIAILCGNKTGGNITNCHVGGSVTDVSYFSGGICGQASGGTFSGCSNSATLGQSASKHSIGGICGYAVTTAVTFSNCSNSGNITTAGTGNYKGGICGNQAIACTYTGCSNTGTLTNGDRVGGIVGMGNNTLATMTSCYNEGNITGNGYIGGLCGGEIRVAMSTCYNEGTIISTSYYVGGLIGHKHTGADSVTDCYNIGSVSVATTLHSVGGITGWDASTGTYSGCYSTTGSITDGLYAGGIVGYATGAITITGCYSSMNILGREGTGGILGYATGAVTISNSYATGDITAGNTTSDSVGGFAGRINNTSATITNCYATGTIGASGNVPEYYIGGFIGQANVSAITNCRSSGSVKGLQNVGGFVGSVLAGTITNSWATGGVTSTAGISGGFCGYTSSGTCNMTSCYSTGDVVSGTGNSGGFIGQHSTAGTIQKCFSIGNVTAGATQKDYWGGFAGRCSHASGVIDNCFSTGNVGMSGSALQYYVGGFIGKLENSRISRSYSTGNMSAVQVGGGFAGWASSGTISDCFCCPTSLACTNASRGYFIGTGGATISNCGGMILNSWRAIGSPAGDITYMGTDPYVYIGNKTYALFTAGTYVWDFTTTPLWYVSKRDFPKLEQKSRVI